MPRAELVRRATNRKVGAEPAVLGLRRWLHSPPLSSMEDRLIRPTSEAEALGFASSVRWRICCCDVAVVCTADRSYRNHSVKVVDLIVVRMGGQTAGSCSMRLR